MLHPVNVSIPFTSELTIIPLGCVHWPHTDTSLLSEWIKRLKEPNTYGLLLGDTFEFARTTTRRYLRAYVGDDTSFSEVDKYIHADVLKLAKRLSPVRNKILGVVRGNHYHTFAGLGGINSEQLLSKELGLNYLGPAGVVRVDLREPGGTENTRDSLVIWMHHHGGSRGSRPSGDVTGLVVTSATPPTVVEQDRVYIRAGCLREMITRKADAGLPDEPDYADEAGYSPRRKGWVELGVKYTRPHKANKRARSRDRKFSVKH